MQALAFLNIKIAPTDFHCLSGLLICYIVCADAVYSSVLAFFANNSLHQKHILPGLRMFFSSKASFIFCIREMGVSPYCLRKNSFFA